MATKWPPCAADLRDLNRAPASVAIRTTVGALATARGDVGIFMAKPRCFQVPQCDNEMLVDERRDFGGPNGCQDAGANARP